MIFVVGAACSGISAVMAILRAAGANVDTSDCFEQTVVKSVLRRLRVDPLGQRPIPLAAHTKPLPDLREALYRKLGEGVDCVKTTKGLHIWPGILQSFPDAKFIGVYRDPDEVAHSCLHTPFMRAYTSHGDWKEWVETYHRRMYELQEAAGDQFYMIEPARYVEGDVSALQSAIAGCHLKWDDGIVDMVYNASKWHGSIIQASEGGNG